LLDCSSRIEIVSGDWIVIDNQKSKSDFGFGLSIQLFHFNLNPRYHNFFYQKIQISMGIMYQQLSQATFIQNFQTITLVVKLYVDKEMSLMVLI
jgi:hypothetical protein